MTFWYIVRTADPFATKLGLTARHHKVVKVTEKVQESSEYSSE